MLLPIDLEPVEGAVLNTMKVRADTRTVSGPNSYDLELQNMTFFGSRALADIIKRTSYQGEPQSKRGDDTQRRTREECGMGATGQIDGDDQNLERGKGRSLPRAVRRNISPLIPDVIAEKRNWHCVKSSKYAPVCYSSTGKAGKRTVRK